MVISRFQLFFLFLYFSPLLVYPYKWHSFTINATSTKNLITFFTSIKFISSSLDLQLVLLFYLYSIKFVVKFVAFETNFNYLFLCSIFYLSLGAVTRLTVSVSILSFLQSTTILYTVLHLLLHTQTR